MNPFISKFYIHLDFEVFWRVKLIITILREKSMTVQSENWCNDWHTGACNYFMSICNTKFANSSHFNNNNDSLATMWTCLGFSRSKRIGKSGHSRKCDEDVCETNRTILINLNSFIDLTFKVWLIFVKFRISLNSVQREILK